MADMFDIVGQVGRTWRFERCFWLWSTIAPPSFSLLSLRAGEKERAILFIMPRLYSCFELPFETDKPPDDDEETEEDADDGTEVGLVVHRHTQCQQTLR